MTTEIKDCFNPNHEELEAALIVRDKKIERLECDLVKERTISSSYEDRAMRIIVRWMMNRSYATGPGDTITDLLNELDWQAQERGWKTHRRLKRRNL